MSKKKRIAIGCIFLSCLLLIYSQKYPLYLDLTTNKHLKPALFLSKKVNALPMPILVTFFVSDALSKELQLDPLTHWLNSISPKVNVSVLNHSSSPETADHYDISSDGIIVIEYNGKRNDIDLIEQIIINESHAIENVQNAITRAVLQLIQLDPIEIMLVHSSQMSLLDSSDPMGLKAFYDHFNSPFVSIKEMHINDVATNASPSDLAILYKPTEHIRPQLPDLTQWATQQNALVIFAHPNFPDISNSIINDPSIVLNNSIVEDTIAHLMQSKNQLIIQYQTTFNQELIGVFPYSGFIDFNENNGWRARALSSPDSFFTHQNDIINGPFSLAIESKNQRLTVLNHYLMLSNLWITQGDNALILEDIIYSHLDEFPIQSARNTRNDFIILSPINALKLGMMLILLPLVAILFIGFMARYLLHQKASPKHAHLPK